MTQRPQAQLGQVRMPDLQNVGEVRQTLQAAQTPQALAASRFKLLGALAAADENRRDTFETRLREGGVFDAIDITRASLLGGHKVETVELKVKARFVEAAMNRIKTAASAKEVNEVLSEIETFINAQATDHYNEQTEQAIISLYEAAILKKRELRPPKTKKPTVGEMASGMETPQPQVDEVAALRAREEAELRELRESPGVIEKIQVANAQKGLGHRTAKPTTYGVTLSFDRRGGYLLATVVSSQKGSDLTRGMTLSTQELQGKRFNSAFEGGLQAIKVKVDDRYKRMTELEAKLSADSSVVPVAENEEAAA